METITIQELSGIIPYNKIVELTDDLNTGLVDLDNLEAAYQSAVCDVELYAARHYAIPLPAVPAVKELHMQLTKCHLYFRRGMQDDMIMALHKSMMARLKDLTPFSLGIPGVGPAIGSAGAGVSVMAPVQKFPSGFMGLED
jgi:phage gp36-like protein